jgi:hypothetical protein
MNKADWSTLLFFLFILLKKTIRHLAKECNAQKCQRIAGGNERKDDQADDRKIEEQSVVHGGLSWFVALYLKSAPFVTTELLNGYFL